MILAIVGPTGIGKSDVALHLAREIPSEILVADSMQVYRGMDLGTGKPDASIRREIPHHGLDLVEPEEEFDVARYLREAIPAIRGIRSRGRLPILVGGAGLYVKALVDGLCEAPGKDPGLRERLLAEVRQEGTGALYGRLQTVDPAAAARIHPHDWRKIVRALEVFLISGRPLTVWQRDTTKPLGVQREGWFVGLTGDRQWLYRRIEVRIDRWLAAGASGGAATRPGAAAGWLEEAKRLHRRRLSRTAREALGYRELFGFLEGKIDWSSAVEGIKRSTRQYAKRQWTWFRADPRVEWIPADGKQASQIGREIMEHLRGSPHWSERSLSISA
ncbi:MAG: tRNA (adenosine(37)-N6)-dimethylallyltransferase MiaA [Candidatus Omnitrophica bacterium]|nr:tRNA (adenosine(37)-N6)-dimethylallyltransferase MiaA [Candidatus Omnitrophota bacterium]